MKLSSNRYLRKRMYSEFPLVIELKLRGLPKTVWKIISFFRCLTRDFEKAVFRKPLSIKNGTYNGKMISDNNKVQ